MEAAAVEGMSKAAAEAEESKAAAATIETAAERGIEMVAAAASAEGIVKSKDSKEPARRRKTKVYKVDQWAIDKMLAEEPKREPCCYAAADEEILQLMEGILDPSELEDSRAVFARTAATFQAAYDIDADILKQYREKGYAMVEVEVGDDEKGH